MLKHFVLQNDPTQAVCPEQLGERRRKILYCIPYFNHMLHSVQQKQAGRFTATLSITEYNFEYIFEYLFRFDD